MDASGHESVLARPLDEQCLAVEGCLASESMQDLARDPRTRTTVLSLLALDRAQNAQYHHWFRWAADDALRLLYAEIARVETRHVATLGSLLPEEDGLTRALWWEFTLIETLGRLAQEETDADVRQGVEYLIPEIVEHSFQITQLAGAPGLSLAQNALGPLAGRRGRPMENQRLATFDLLKRPAGCLIDDPMTLARLQLAVAVVHAAVSDYLALVDSDVRADVRYVCAEVAAVKEGHLILLESLLDSQRPALDRAIASECGETVWYGSALAEQADPRLAAMFRSHLADEKGQLERLRVEAARRGRGKTMRLPLDTPGVAQGQPLRPASEYVDDLIRSQLQLRSKGRSYVEIGKVNEAFS